MYLRVNRDIFLEKFRVNLRMCPLYRILLEGKTFLKSGFNAKSDFIHPILMFTFFDEYI